jgi:hypothetical protein
VTAGARPPAAAYPLSCCRSWQAGKNAGLNQSPSQVASIESCCFRDFHIAMDAVAPFLSQYFNLICCKRSEVPGDRVKPYLVIQRIAILHRPQTADRQLRPAAPSRAKVRKPIELPARCLLLAPLGGNEVIPVDGRCARAGRSLSLIDLISGNAVPWCCVWRHDLEQIELRSRPIGEPILRTCPDVSIAPAQPGAVLRTKQESG